MDIYVQLKNFPPGTLDQAEIVFYDAGGVVQKVVKLTSTVPFSENFVYPGGRVEVRKFAVPPYLDKAQNAGLPGRPPKP